MSNPNDHSEWCRHDLVAEVTRLRLDYNGAEEMATHMSCEAEDAKKELTTLRAEHESQVTALVAEKCKLASLLEAALEDVKMVDWLEENKERIFCAGWTAEDGWVISENPKDAYSGASILGEGPTLRAAITQAMEGGAE